MNESTAQKIAPIEVGYLVATESGKTVDQSSFDALQKILIRNKLFGGFARLGQIGFAS